MAKSTVSHRLDGELLARADVYAKTRGVTRSILIEEGLRTILDLAEGGVPDLPETERAKPGPKPKVKPKPFMTRDELNLIRQRALNDHRYGGSS